jgi:aminoglycoside 6'-N-acetyltransferase
MAAATGYAFRPMTDNDLPRVRGWLETPHVAQWWGDPTEQYALVSGDLGHPSMAQFIVTREDRPFADLQCYDPLAWPEHDLAGFPTGTRGIDQFIGEPAMIARGHGSALTRAFVERLFAAGTPRVITDPDPANGRAVRAYEKAGFRAERTVDTPSGRALLMVCEA